MLTSEELETLRMWDEHKCWKDEGQPFVDPDIPEDELIPVGEPNEEDDDGEETEPGPVSGIHHL